MNEDDGMDKQRPGPSCILTPCSRIGYKPFHPSHKGRSCSFSFLGWSARTFPNPTGHVSQCRWLLHSVAFFWCWTRYGFDLLLGVVGVLCLSPAEVQGTLLPLEGTGLGPGMLDWWGASGQALLQEFVCPKGSKCKLQWRTPW